LTSGHAEDPQELQYWQGLDVIAEIWLARPDLLFVFITDAPKMWSVTHHRTLVEGIHYLRSTLHHSGIPIHAVIQKDEIRLGETAVYRNLIIQFWQWVHTDHRSVAPVIISSVGIININSQIGQQVGIQPQPIDTSDWLNPN
jgi:hypothetical protein